MIAAGVQNPFVFTASKEAVAKLVKLEIGSNLNFSSSFSLKIIFTEDLILFIQTAPKPSRGEPALLLCQWLMCRLYYIFDFLGDMSARILLSI